jgi:SagB-type dehydrogenase family enzyme
VDRRDVGVRRSPFLVTYWTGDEHRVYSFCNRTEHRCTPLVFTILESAAKWRSRAEIAQSVSDSDAESVYAVLDGLERDGLLESNDRPTGEAERALAKWESWNPAAGFFHAVTRTAPIGGEAPRPKSLVVAKSFPSPVKAYEGRTRIELPALEGDGTLDDVLHERRTWREFGERNLTLVELTTLLGETFAVQKWMEVEDGDWVALKTSPSGGARHSIEAYVFAFGVDGLDGGTYHYNPDTHSLTSLGSATRHLLAEFIPGREAFHGPAVFIALTSVFARMQYKYPLPHAYRVVLLDAGHLSQTFALVATALGLAPFCTAAIDADAIERHLELDGISESAILGLGVGTRPAGKDWSPMHDHSAPPATRPPKRSSRAR